MSLRVSQPLRSMSSQADPKLSLSYPVLGARPFTTSAPAAANAVPARGAGEDRGDEPALARVVARGEPAGSGSRAEAVMASSSASMTSSMTARQHRRCRRQCRWRKGQAACHEHDEPTNRDQRRPLPPGEPGPLHASSQQSDQPDCRRDQTGTDEEPAHTTERAQQEQPHHTADRDHPDPTDPVQHRPRCARRRHVGTGRDRSRPLRSDRRHPRPGLDPGFDCPRQSVLYRSADCTHVLGLRGRPDHVKESTSRPESRRRNLRDRMDRFAGTRAGCRPE